MGQPNDSAGPAGSDAAVVPAEQRGEQFAQLVRRGRQAAGLSQDELAQATGISRSQLIRWESGKAERPEPGMVRKVFKFLHLDPREATIALGLLTREEAYGQAPRRLEPMIGEVIVLLQDPTVPDYEKEQWLRYLRFLRNERAHSAQQP